MKYKKPPLSFVQQADLLISRGLQVPKRDELIEKLQVVNYYRLSAYWFPFKQADETLKPGTTLDLVWGRYVFDRQLRLLVMDAIERVEVAIKTRMAEQHALKHGGFGYLSRDCFIQPAHRWNKAKAAIKRIIRPILPFCIAAQRKFLDPHDDFLGRIRQTAAESREEFVRHYFEKYTDEKDLPIWMAVEIMTLGNMLAMFQRLTPEEKRALAGSFKVMARLSVDTENLKNLVFSLQNQTRREPGEGFKPLQDFHGLTPQNLQKDLKAYVKTCARKTGIEKIHALRKGIRRIHYSKKNVRLDYAFGQFSEPLDSPRAALPAPGLTHFSDEKGGFQSPAFGTTPRPADETGRTVSGGAFSQAAAFRTGLDSASPPTKRPIGFTPMSLQSQFDTFRNGGRGGI